MLVISIEMVDGKKNSCNHLCLRSLDLRNVIREMLDKGKCLTPMESLCRFWFPKVEIQMLHVGMHLGS